MSSIFNRMKDTLNAAGKEAKKLGRIGQLKIDLMNAKGTLEEHHKALGQLSANRLIDRNEPVVEKSEVAVQSILDDIKEAKQKINELEKQIEQTKNP